MKLSLLAALLAAAPASAQVAVGKPLDALPPAMGAAIDAARAQGAPQESLAPAAVDPKPVATLFERLAKDGEQLQTQEGTQDAFTRLSNLDKNGRAQNLQVGVVETDGPAAPDADGQPTYQDLVLRRYFTSLQAQSEDWTVAKDGSGRVDTWHYSVSLDGVLTSVEHDVIPLKRGADGVARPDYSASRGFRMSPSSKAVQARWKALTKKLLLLGRATPV
jgi:hypothetical protein